MWEPRTSSASILILAVSSTFVSNPVHGSVRGDKFISSSSFVRPEEPLRGLPPAKRVAHSLKNILVL
jgi:hypothetical protein